MTSPFDGLRASGNAGAFEHRPSASAVGDARAAVGVSLVVTALTAVLAVAAPSSAATLVVAPGGEWPTIGAALAAAADGDTIEVRGGVHPAPVVVGRRVALVGVGRPTIEAGGAGTAVRLEAPGIRMSGFRVRRSGSSLDEEHSGIAVGAPEVVVEDNVLEDVLFGIYLRKASDGIVRRNRIVAKDLPLARRGDAIRLWSSHRVRVEENVVRRTRDVVIWYSEGVTIRGNDIRHGRYGLHFMYCDDAAVEENVLEQNSVGAFLMYSRRLSLRRNRIVGNRGPSGYGIGLKDMDDAVVAGNLVADNRVGAYLDNTPREIDATTRFEGNVFAWNDAGVVLQPSLRGNRFSENSFVDNGEQVALTGGGVLEGNAWSVSGRGNYWSDYAGYDRDRDGVGDLPYRAEKLFEHLTERRPQLRIFLHGPAVGAIDFAARAFPVIRPRPKLEDPRPLMATIPPAGVPHPSRPEPRWPFGVAAAGLFLVAGVLRLAPFAPVGGGGRPTEPVGAGGAAIEAAGVTRRFGTVAAVEDLSFVVRPGESVALWGRNGAGKTTALRCVLGVVRFEGSVRIAGADVAREGRTCRARIGFVPQEASFYDDLTVAQTIALFGRLRAAAPADPAAWLERFALGGEAQKRVRELSGGRKRLLALAVALLGDPPILLLDEPLANLDVAARERYLRLLGELRDAGKTILFTSHRRSDVVRLADRVVVLDRGRKIDDGRPDEVERHLGAASVLRLALRDAEVSEAIEVLAAVGFRARPNGHGIRVAVAAGERVGPILRLLERGIRVHDLDLEGGEGD